MIVFIKLQTHYVFCHEPNPKGRVCVFLCLSDAVWSAFTCFVLAATHQATGALMGCLSLISIISVDFQADFIRVIDEATNREMLNGGGGDK